MFFIRLQYAYGRLTHSLFIWMLCLFLASFSFIAQAATWQAGPSLNTARDQFSGGVINGKIYVFGGDSNLSPNNLNSTEMLDPTVGSWVYKANNNDCIPGTQEISGAIVSSKLYALGDYVFSGGGVSCSSSTQEYDPTANTWTSKAPMPIVQSAAPTAVYNNKIYVFGHGIETVDAYDPASDTWEFVTNMPQALAGYAVAVVGNKAYVIGGGSVAPRQLISTIYAYDFITGTWTTSGLAPLPNPRVFSYNNAAPVVNGKIYLIGGTEITQANYSATTKVDIYDTVSNSWQTGTPLPSPTACHLSVVANNKLYVVGGDNGSGDSSCGNGITAAVWSLDLPSYAPAPGITVNGSHSPITVQTATPISINVNLDPGNAAGQNADWWAVAYGSSIGWYSYVYPSGWVSGIVNAVQSPLFSLPSFNVFSGSLPPGQYTVYFGVDTTPDGTIDNPLFYDSVQVTVN